MAMLGPVAYVMPMAIPLLIGNYWLDPWVLLQGWPGWGRMVFWLLYTGISTGVTFAATIQMVQMIEKRQPVHKRAT